MTGEQYRGTIESYSTEMVAEVCPTCGILFLFSKNYQQHLRKTHQSFYCPNGHSQWYPEKTEAEKLKQELRQKENELAQVSTSKIQLENQLNKANKKLKRISEGQCPCCDKTYKHLANHMKSKHPEFKK